MKKRDLKKHFGIAIFILGLLYMLYLVAEKTTNQKKIDAAKENTYAPSE